MFFEENNPSNQGVGPKIAIITGASRGFGLEVARLPIHESYKVFNLCRSEPPDDLSLTAEHVAIDLSDNANTINVSKKLFEEIRNINPHEVILIHNAVSAEPY